MLTHEKMKQQILDNDEVKAEYNALKKEFLLFDELIKARTKAGLTQTEVARRMNTKTPAIARLESGGGNKKHSPTVSTLHKYAEAVGCYLKIKLVQA